MPAVHIRPVLIAAARRRSGANEVAPGEIALPVEVGGGGGLFLRTNPPVEVDRREMLLVSLYIYIHFCCLRYIYLY